MKEVVSIIVPVYNVEVYLEECLNSILAQTYPHLEIILVDDGSTDSSFSICKKYKEKDNRIVLLQKENGGLASARNYGLTAVTGKYIGFVDSDDTIEPTMIGDMLEKFALDSSVDMVVCGFKRYDDKTGKVYSIEMINGNWHEINNTNRGEFLYFNPGVWNKLYKAEIFEKVKFTEIRLAEDLILLVDILDKVEKIHRVEKALYNYRVRDNSLINSVKKEQFDELLEQLIIRRKEIVEKSDSKQHLMLFDAIVFLHVGVSLTFRLTESDKKNIKQYIKSTKMILDSYFLTWKVSKHIGFFAGVKKGIKGIGIWGCRLLYKCNLFILFVYFYHFIQEKFKIDIKW